MKLASIDPLYIFRNSYWIRDERNIIVLVPGDSYRNRGEENDGEITCFQTSGGVDGIAGSSRVVLLFPNIVTFNPFGKHHLLAIAQKAVFDHLRGRSHSDVDQQPDSDHIDQHERSAV